MNTDKRKVLIGIAIVVSMIAVITMVIIMVKRDQKVTRETSSDGQINVGKELDKKVENSEDRTNRNDTEETKNESSPDKISETVTTEEVTERQQLEETTIATNNDVAVNTENSESKISDNIDNNSGNIAGENYGNTDSNISNGEDNNGNNVNNNVNNNSNNMSNNSNSENNNSNNENQNSNSQGENFVNWGNSNTNTDTSGYVDEVIRLVNEERAKEGLQPLTKSNDLCKAAGIRAEEIVNLFDHTRPDGRDCFTVLDDYNIRYMAVGENIAAGQSNPSGVMYAWMNSSGHRSNILSDSFGQIGIEFIKGKGDYGTYWVQIFTN